MTVVWSFISLLIHLPSLISTFKYYLNSLNAESNPICHMLALLGAHHILHISRIRVKHFIQKWN